MEAPLLLRDLQLGTFGAIRPEKERRERQTDAPRQKKRNNNYANSSSISLQFAARELWGTPPILLPAALFFSTEGKKEANTETSATKRGSVFARKAVPRHAGFTLAVRPRLSFRPQTADILFQEPEVSAIRSGGTVVSFHSSLPVSITAEALQTHFRSPSVLRGPGDHKPRLDSGTGCSR